MPLGLPVQIRMSRDRRRSEGAHCSALLTLFRPLTPRTPCVSLGNLYHPRFRRSTGLRKCSTILVSAGLRWMPKLPSGRIQEATSGPRLASRTTTIAISLPRFQPQASLILISNNGGSCAPRTPRRKPTTRWARARRILGSRTAIHRRWTALGVRPRRVPSTPGLRRRRAGMGSPLHLPYQIMETGSSTRLPRRPPFGR